jgi:hypothetical protein
MKVEGSSPPAGKNAWIRKLLRGRHEHDFVGSLHTRLGTSRPEERIYSGVEFKG